MLLIFDQTLILWIIVSSRGSKGS